jgi:hypothetical protein
LPADDPALGLWLQLAGQSDAFALHAVAHRDALARPRPVTSDFGRWWDGVQLILLAVLRRFRERFLEPLREVDRLLEVQQPSAAHITLLRNNVPNNPVFLGYFFDRNHNPLWLQHLVDAGYLRYPPEEGHWPQAGYLVRMAKDAQVQRQVCDAILLMPDSGNPLVHDELLKAALAMSPNEAARLIDKIESWARMATRFSVSDFGDLMEKLAEGGEMAAALRLAEALLKIEASRPDAEAESAAFLPIPQTHLDLWDYQQILAKNVPRLVKSAGLDAFNLLCDLLAEAIRFSLRDPDQSVPNDVSHVWLPAVAGRGQILSLEATLAGSVRDASINLLRSGQAIPAQLVAMLEARMPRWWIFRRIAMFVLLEFGDGNLDFISHYLVDRDTFDTPECLHEYVLLLQRWFPSLSAAQQEQIFGWIDAGLLPHQRENLKRNVAQFTSETRTPDPLIKSHPRRYSVTSRETS